MTVSAVNMKSWVPLAIFIAMPLAVRAQEVPAADMFVGYSALKPIPGNAVAGWEASATVNLTRWLGVEGDFAGHYQHGFSETSFMGGPRFAHRFGSASLFVHGLAGGDASGSNTALAIAGGAGFDYRLSEHLSYRIVQADYFTTESHGLFSKNFRLSTGLVFTFGGPISREESRRPLPSTSGLGAPRPSASPQRAANPSETASPTLGITGRAVESGFQIATVQAGSLADQIFLKPGDIITGIDGKEVHTGADLERAIGASASGVVKLSCLIQTGMGPMPSERELKVR